VAVTDTYTARVERDGRFWLVWVVELERATQARHLGEVEFMARDMIALMLEIEPDSFELVVDLVLPTDVRENVEAAERLREESARANRAAADAARAAARGLADAGLPLRDIGIALGVSRQRAHQLLSA
jgi:hypothetical protein